MLRLETTWYFDRIRIHRIESLLENTECECTESNEKKTRFWKLCESTYSVPNALIRATLKVTPFFDRRYRNNQGSLECQTFIPEQEIDQIRACKKLDIIWKNIFEDSQVWLWPLFLSLCQFRWFSKMHHIQGGDFIRPAFFLKLWESV